MITYALLLSYASGVLLLVRKTFTLMDLTGFAGTSNTIKQPQRHSFLGLKAKTIQAEAERRNTRNYTDFLDLKQ